MKINNFYIEQYIEKHSTEILETYCKNVIEYLDYMSSSEILINLEELMMVEELKNKNVKFILVEVTDKETKQDKQDQTKQQEENKED